jgi:galactokinase/mevalonate kinase-like predicted kinase
MSNELIETIVSEDKSLRNRSINYLLQNKNKDELLKFAEELEALRISSSNLYHKVRASLFLYAIYRFYLQEDIEIKSCGRIPLEGVKAARHKNFEESIAIHLKEIENGNLNGAVCSAIAHSYYQLAFKYLFDQVKLSISQCKENSSLFDAQNLDDYPYRVPEELTIPDPETGLYPVGVDTTPVRIDPSHSEWSDIFFLGMDFPEGARVINISVNLGIHGTEVPINPPCECYSRFIEEPLIYLRSVDLGLSLKVSTFRELFNFDDRLSLLKAGIVASGIVPPSFEKKDIQLKDILHKLLGKRGGIEVATRVNYIPKGSRLAVSTTLLSTIIARLMRFSGQIKSQTGPLTEEERRLIASRAILGEWMGGSGGGWQDSGGLWPGIKLITGELAEPGSPEFGISRGCLLPNHVVFSREEIPEEVERKIVDSMVLVHGGLSQDIGPVLEMVTERYLLRYEREWNARIKGIELFDKIVDAIKRGDMRELGRLTTEDWEEAIQPIIPWTNTAFTEDLIAEMKGEFKDDYWGFLMLGGASGGGMGFIVNPLVRERFKKRVAQVMVELKDRYNYSLPFVIDPMVYDFEINHKGNMAHLLKGKEAKIPGIYENIPICYPELVSGSKQEMLKQACPEEILNQVQNDTFRVQHDSLIDEKDIKKRYGFDSESHEYLMFLLKKGDISLAKNRLPSTTDIQDVSENEIFHFEKEYPSPTLLPDTSGEGMRGREYYKLGLEAIKNNEVAVVTLAGGIGSRWSEGSTTVKAINPFLKINGKFRTFIEIHLAKSRETERLYGQKITHVFTTSYLTHTPVEDYLQRFNWLGYEGKILLSQAKSIGRRVYPTERDIRFIPPILRFNPQGHWYEVPNLIKNGVLAKMLKKNPNLKYLLCHNIDTIGAYVEPVLLGAHIANQSCLTFEVIPRRIDDKGGGLAKINGHIQLIEGLALPREDDEYKLSYYNTLTNWITIDSLLGFFKLNRDLIMEAENQSEKYNKILVAIHQVEKRIPIYVTIKNVKYLMGSRQEDVHPVAQFEKLWGDMTGLKDLRVSYVAVSRYRGQQLKDPSHLDRWLRDGSFEYLKSKACF